MVAKQAQLAARRVGRVVLDGQAVDVSDFLANGGAGNRDTEFDGSADGIGDEVGSLQYGSSGGRGRRREPLSSQHRALYILCLTRIAGGSTHALQVRKSHERLIYSNPLCDMLICWNSLL